MEFRAGGWFCAVSLGGVGDAPVRAAGSGSGGFTVSDGALQCARCGPALETIPGLLRMHSVVIFRCL